jgi:ATP adenylyltransferase
MDRIWAPWRIKYIKRNKTKGCFFCRFCRAKSDKKNYIVLRGRYSFIILNVFPYNNGHLMVAPYKHKPALSKLNHNEILDMMELVKRSQKLLKKTLKPHGFNIGINEGRVSGAGVVHHVHIHIVPRWHGDHNFMPVTGCTRVIPQSLDALYEKLVKANEQI